MSGIDINRIVGLDTEYTETLQCAICLNLLVNPLTTKCGHTYCHSCLNQMIENNRKQCPECREVFTAKRTKESVNNNIVLISHNRQTYVFSKNLIANQMITKLKIKCDFEFNGCEESVEIGLLSKHVKQCLHRLCKTCGFTAGQTEDHYCIGLLKNEIKDWKEKYEKCNKTIEEMKLEISKLRERVTQNTDFCVKYPKLFSVLSKCDQDTSQQKHEEREQLFKDFVQCIIDGKVDNHLIGVYNQTIYSKRHQNFDINRYNYKTLFYSINHFLQEQNISRHCYQLYKSIICENSESNLKFRLSYVSSVWIPEAIIKAISIVRNCDWSESEQIFTRITKEDEQADFRKEIFTLLSRFKIISNRLKPC